MNRSRSPLRDDKWRVLTDLRMGGWIEGPRWTPPIAEHFTLYQPFAAPLRIYRVEFAVMEWLIEEELIEHAPDRPQQVISEKGRALWEQAGPVWEDIEQEYPNVP